MIKILNLDISCYFSKSPTYNFVSFPKYKMNGTTINSIQSGFNHPICRFKLDLYLEIIQHIFTEEPNLKCLIFCERLVLRNRWKLKI